MKDVDSALADLREIKRAIERADGTSAFPSGFALKTHATIHIVFIALFFGLAVVDLTQSPSLSDLIHASHKTFAFRVLAVSVILVLLCLLCGMVYLLVWRAARSSGESFASFVSRNFRYLSLTSFASDLYLKFAMIGLVILAGRPDWVAGLLIACTGDYLIQGRGFVLPLRTGLFLGTIYLVASFVIIGWYECELWQASAVLLLAGTVSLVHIARLVKRHQQLQGDGE